MNYGYDNQYSTTAYSATGAGGGGFINTGSQPDGAQSKAGKDTLRPVTIKQINDAEHPHPDADFRIDGVEVSQVTFVGQIRNISSTVTNYTYRIDDGTGIVEVKLWIDPDAGSSNLVDEDGNPKLKDGDYVRAFGTLKNLNDRRYVGARTGGIKQVTDLNEINYHLLEATAVHLYFTRGPPGQDQGGQTNGNYDSAGGDAMDTSGGMRQLPSGLSAAARRVFKCISDTPQNNEGLHMHDVAARLNMDVSEVQRAGNELLENALLYTTVDDETWAVLDS